MIEGARTDSLQSQFKVAAYMLKRSQDPDGPRLSQDELSDLAQQVRYSYWKLQLARKNPVMRDDHWIGLEYAEIILAAPSNTLPC